MQTIRVGFYQEWRKLQEAKLTLETPTAPEDVEDMDPTPYRQDTRVWYNPWPNRMLMTHFVGLECRSDDDRYRLFFFMDELADNDLEETVRVFEQEVSFDLTPFTFNTNQMKETAFSRESIVQGIKVKVKFETVKWQWD